MGRSKKFVKIILIILAVIALFVVMGAIFMSNVGKKLDALYDIQIQDVDLSAIPDGTYEGKHDVFPISVQVEVTVKGNKITEINLIKHVNGQGSAAEAIPEKVIKSQSLQIDAISGATLSSKVILLAIEDALKHAAGK